jgi:hypothetical protein
VYTPEKLHFVQELGEREGGVSALICKICAELFGYSQEVAMFERGVGGGKTVFTGVMLEGGVH